MLRDDYDGSLILKDGRRGFKFCFTDVPFMMASTGTGAREVSC